MSVSWAFTLSHQLNLPTRFLSITGHWNGSLPSGASLWNDMFGRVEGQYTTIPGERVIAIHRIYVLSNSKLKRTGHRAG